MLQEHETTTSDGTYGHQLDQKSRTANLVKSDLEDFLAVHMQDDLGYARIKTGDEIYKVLSDAIEKLNDIAYHERENFNERNS